MQTLGLCKRFGRSVVLDRLDLQIPDGSICAVMGPSGTGKSVLIRHMLGLMKADAGEILVRDRSLRTMSAAAMTAMRREIGVMFQDGALFSSMTLFENVAFPLRQHTDYRDRVVRDLVMEQLGKVGLSDAADRYPSELSGGMRKRAGLARAVILDPPLVIADEPDSGLDPVRTALLGELLIEHHERGGTIIVITHNALLAKRVSDYVALLWRGAVVASGPAGEMWSSGDAFVEQFLTGNCDGPLGMD